MIRNRDPLNSLQMNNRNANLAMQRVDGLWLALTSQQLRRQFVPLNLTCISSWHTFTIPNVAIRCKKTHKKQCLILCHWISRKKLERQEKFAAGYEKCVDLQRRCVHACPETTQKGILHLLFQSL